MTSRRDEPGNPSTGRERGRTSLQTAARQRTERLLVLDDVKTAFQTPRGLVRAVDGVSFSRERSRCMGIVGESGCGKTILSRSIMGLLPLKGTVRSGSIEFEGREIGQASHKELRQYWGREMAMIFQDPMSSLNPLMKIGNQIAEPLRVHMGMSKSDARENALALLASVGIPEPAKRIEQYPYEM